MIDRKKAVEDQMKEYQAAVSKTLDVFGKENYGQAVTQWNFTSLRQVLEGAFNDLSQKLHPIIMDYEATLEEMKPKPETEIR